MNQNFRHTCRERFDYIWGWLGERVSSGMSVLAIVVMSAALEIRAYKTISVGSPTPSTVMAALIVGLAGILLVIRILTTKGPSVSDAGIALLNSIAAFVFAWVAVVFGTDVVDWLVANPRYPVTVVCALVVVKATQSRFHGQSRLDDVALKMWRPLDAELSLTSASRKLSERDRKISSAHEVGHALVYAAWISYAEALLVATPANRLVDGKKPLRLTGVSPEQMAKMEREMSNLQAQYKLVEQTYGQDVLNLVLAKGYLAKMLENDSVRAYLLQQQPDLLAEFEAIVETVSLDQQQSSVVV